MTFAGLDLHKKEVEAALPDEDGRVLLRSRFPAIREAFAKKHLSVQHTVAAVHDGTIRRNAGNIGAYIVVNTADLKTVDLPTYFAMARGTKEIPPLAMTKWFDTNLRDERVFAGHARLGARYLARFQPGNHASVHPLKHRRLVPAHRPYRRRIRLRLATMRGKGAQHRNQLVGERLKAQVRIPQAQIKRVRHLY